MKIKLKIRCSLIKEQVLHQIMKTFIFLLCTTVFSFNVENSFSQEKVTIDKDQLVKVDRVFKIIQKQTNFDFIYPRGLFRNNPKVELKKGEILAADLVRICLANSDLNFEISKDNVIVIKKKPTGSLPFSIDNEKAQGVQVSGSVIDSNGQPLLGANILEKGTANGAQTDFDGHFSITVANQNVLLVISYLGYLTQEIPINKQTTFSVVLKEDIAGLDEVIIVGYGTQKKADLTGAIVSVKEEDFAPGTNSNAVQLLNGTASGVAVSQTSSAPGASLKIQIRGAGSINSSNAVLFVVDGLPGVDPSSLSPGDIESIDILKDASSASIYGTRAANGVVLITTKKGKAGKTTLSYSVYTGIQSVDKKLDVLGASDYMSLINLRQGSQVFSDSEIAAAGKGTNWQDELFRDALIQNHQITMSGGNEKGNYYIGLNYFNQNGIVKKSSNQKYNFRINVQTRPLDNLVVSTNINFTRGLTHSILFSNSANEAAGPLNSAIQFDPTLSAGLDDNGRYFLNPTIALDNPVALIEGTDNQSLSTRFYGSLSPDYEFLENLTVTLRLGGEANNTRSDFYRGRETLNGLSNGGQANIASNEFTHWLAEYLLKYENTFNDKHSFSILGGATFEEFQSRNVGASTAGFLSDVLGTNSLQSGDGDLRDNVSSSKFKNQLNGFIGRLTYGFDNKYLITTSFRVDGSSRFSEKNKYGFFPSASVAWRINNEQFMENIDWINNLKLRVGYGELGNQAIGNFETIQTLTPGGNAVLGGTIAQGVVPSRLPNPDLKWETTTEYNIGLDFGFFSNKISGSIDYFNRKTNDQLFRKPLPSVVGFTSVRTNLGEVINKGVDISLKTINIDGDNFKWESSLTASFLKNEVTELPDFISEIIGGTGLGFINGYTIVRPGDPLRAFYGYEINGIIQEGDDITNIPIPNVQGYGAGYPRFVDQNDDGVIDSDDRTILGDPFPDLNFGFNNKFSYKNLSLSLFFQGVQGIETLDGNVGESLYPTNSARNTISRYFLDRWTPENPSNTLPSGVNPSLYGGARAINSLLVKDASFVRLKNITLGYNLPSKLTDKLGIASLNIYLAADNVFTITDFEGYDPDASASGTGVTRSSFNSYPLAKTFRVGLNVKF